MLGFEIGQRESGFYSERTESQTDRITEPLSTVLVYRYCSSNLENHDIELKKYPKILCLCSVGRNGFLEPVRRCALQLSHKRLDRKRRHHLWCDRGDQAAKN